MIPDTTDLPDGLLGSTTYNMHFTLDDDGQWDKEKKYTTVGTKVSIEGYVDYPEGPTWTIIAKSSTGWKKRKTALPRAKRSISAFPQSSARPSSP